LACRDYPRTNVVDAVYAALRDPGTNPEEMRSLAALVTAWLLDDESDHLSPPLTAMTAERIRTQLRRGAS
jgi:hypothetical protein